MKINGIFVACAVLSAAATYPALDLAETLGISENRISPISTELIGGCIFKDPNGSVSSLSVEKSKYFLSEGIVLGVSEQKESDLIKT
jgi:hypothetical protein